MALKLSTKIASVVGNIKLGSDNVLRLTLTSYMDMIWVDNMVKTLNNIVKLLFTV